jgi:hypothetical protein
LTDSRREARKQAARLSRTGDLRERDEAVGGEEEEEEEEDGEKKGRRWVRRWVVFDGAGGGWARETIHGGGGREIEHR